MNTIRLNTVKLNTLSMSLPLVVGEIPKGNKEPEGYTLFIAADGPFIAADGEFYVKL